MAAGPAPGYSPEEWERLRRAATAPGAGKDIRLRPETGGRGGIADTLKNLLSYEFDPEKELQLRPDQRVLPGPMEGYEYRLRPGETYDDANRVIGADGKPVTFVNPPMLKTVADYLGYMTGGVGGVGKGGTTLGSGIYRVAGQDIGPSLKAAEDADVAALARRMEAAHKRASKGYGVPSAYDEEALAKMDKALTTVSQPAAAYYDRAQRALDLGYDTPAFHVTSFKGEPDTLHKAAGTPFRELDPTIIHRGATYFGDKPSAIVKGGAAVGAHGDDAMIYPFLVKDVMGEHPMPPGLYRAMPDTVTHATWGGPAKGSIDDIIHAIETTPGHAENLAAVQEAARRVHGPDFMPEYFNETQKGARNQLAHALAGLYYEPVPGGAPTAFQKIDPLNFEPVAHDNPYMPGYAFYESGARGNKWGQPRSGLHSPLQNEVGGVGFSGARIDDEMRNAGGKSFAMIDPTGVRAVGAKFKNPFGDLLSGTVPPSWWGTLWDPSQGQPDPSSKTQIAP